MRGSSREGTREREGREKAGRWHIMGMSMHVRKSMFLEKREERETERG